jgi:hypothetical protein
MVNITIGDIDARDWGLPAGTARVQRRRRDDLLAKVGRGIKQKPTFAVSTDRQARLTSWLDPLVAVPSQLADRTEAIPLGKSTSGRRTEHEYAQGVAFHIARKRRVKPLDFSGSVAGDFHADADFGDCRGCPSHSISPLTSVGGHLYVRDIMYHLPDLETICRKPKTAFIAEV